MAIRKTGLTPNTEAGQYLSRPSMNAVVPIEYFSLSVGITPPNYDGQGAAEKEPANSALLTRLLRCCSASTERAFLHEAQSWWTGTLRSEPSNGTCSSMVHRHCPPATGLRVMMHERARHTSHTATDGGLFSCRVLTRTGVQAVVLGPPILSAHLRILVLSSL